MSRNLALFLILAGSVIMIFNIWEVAESSDSNGAWLRIASNICVIIVGVFMLKNFKKQRK